MTRGRYLLTIMDSRRRPHVFTASSDQGAMAVASGHLLAEIARNGGRGVLWRLDEIDWSRRQRRLRRVDIH